MTPPVLRSPVPIAGLLAASTLVVSILALALRGPIGSWSVDSRGEASDASSSIVQASPSATDVESQLTGRLVRLLVREGDRVEEGELIAVVASRAEDDHASAGQSPRSPKSAHGTGRPDSDAARRLERARAAVKRLQDELHTPIEAHEREAIRAEADLGAARRNREQLVRHLHPAQARDLAAALVTAEEELEEAQRALVLQRDLLDRGYVSRRTLETFQLKVDLSRVRVEAATETLAKLNENQKVDLDRLDRDMRTLESELKAKRSALATRGKRQRDLVAARSALQEAESAILRAAVSRDGPSGGARTRQAETQVRAPLAGIVTRTFLEEGELVAGAGLFGGGSPIVRIEP
jgi:HlyD family secretion protein